MHLLAADEIIIVGLLLTGEPVFMTDTVNFVIPNNGSQDIKIVVCDKNLNQLPEGTILKITTSKGVLNGLSSINETELEYEFRDSNRVGPDMDGQLDHIEHIITIKDNTDDADDIDEPTLIVITVEWEDWTYSWSIEGTIN